MAIPRWAKDLQAPTFGAAARTSNPAWAFTPFAPPPIPSGYYDPNLDASRDSASRGLQYTEQDVGLGGRRAQEDWGLESAGINQQFARNVELLTRNYGNLATSQGEQQNKYGVLGGGAALQAAAKRAANQAREQQVLQEDRDTAQNRGQQLYDRGVADRGTALSRARGEDLFFGLDTGAQKSFQAQQAGYNAPTGPANEFVGPDGQPRRTIRAGGVVYVVDKSGKIISQRRAA